MNGWTAVVPIKPAADRKTRLRHHLPAPDRLALTEHMLAHVLDVLARAGSVAEVAILSAAPPDGWGGRWFADTGCGLNAELSAVAGAVPRRLLVLHADLPGLAPDDVDALVAATARGVAIAPDRHAVGTNALAAENPAGLVFAFGAESFARHRALMPDHEVVRRAGLGLDLDLPEDLDRAARLGHLSAMCAAPRGT